MIGETVRPPCVVSSPKSSPSDRSHKTFPSRLKPARCPPLGKHVNVSTRRIADRRRPTDAMWRHVAKVNIQAMLPEKFSGVGVEAHQAFLQRLAFTGRILEIDSISHNDRRRATAIGRLPCKVVTTRGPLHGKIFFRGDTITCRSAPFGPIARARRARKLARSSDKWRQD